MLLEELREHYGTWANLTRKLELGSTTYLRWRKIGYIPFNTQCVLEKKTGGKFIADMEHGKLQK